jgi:transposase-like protein
MARSSRHPREVRERAVALVLESQSDYRVRQGYGGNLPFTAVIRESETFWGR